MAEFKRSFVPGGCYFFTLVTANRRPIFSDEANVEHLRAAFRKEMQRRPFEFQAVVIMPDHLHALWQLPVDDFDYSNRWREIKKHVSKSLDAYVWQKSFWEHTIRDKRDWQNHLDYIHYNPVRHGYVEQVRDWKYSSFHQWCGRGFYDRQWGSAEPSAEVDARCE